MKTTFNSLKQDVQNGLEQIGGQYALSGPVAAVSFIWLTAISMTYDSVRLGSSAAGWLVASAIAHLVVMAIALPIRATLLPVKPRESKPGLTLGVYAFLGVTRSTTIGALAVLFELAPTAEFGYRQVAGLFSITTGLAITSIVVSSIIQRQESLTFLRTEREQLSAIKDESENLFEEKRKEVLDIIDHSIKPSLDEINEALNQNSESNAQLTEQTTKLISALIDQQLRPISDALHQPNAFLSGDREWSKVRTPYVRRSSRISVQSLFSPLLITFFMSSLTVSGAVYYAGFAALFIGIGVFIPFFVILWLAKRFIPENWILNIWVAAPLTVFFHIIAAIPSLGILIWLEQYFAAFREQFANAVLGIALASIVIAFLRAIQVERNNFEKDLRAANDEAASILANLNQRIWVNRKNAAQLLHGSVQASLTAANVRLHQGNLTAEDLLKVREDIARAINALTDSNSGSIDLEEVIEDLIDLWDGVCDIDVAISPEVVDRVNGDITAVHCTNEFLKECINNAIKHGKASQIDIRASRLEAGDIEVQVENNGQVTALNHSGLGTRILDEITLSWRRTQTDQGTLVSGVIAVSQNTP
ncbi:MAG: hypothetical protein RL355_503 [Actinomycetota bacterium]|jgi:two-component sensor histidine kinase